MLRDIANFKITYYMQSNIFCILILLVLLLGYLKKNGKTTDQRIFRWFIVNTAVFCLVDMGSFLLDGCPGVLVHYLLYLVNILYFTCIGLTGVLWDFYVIEKVKQNTGKEFHNSWIVTIPFIAFTLVLLSTPWTGMFFTISADNVYSRGVLVWGQWVVESVYLFVPTIYVIARVIIERNRPERKKYYPLFIVIIGPVITMTCQILFFGLSVLPLGFTIAALYIFFRQQNTNAYTDELTGLNNRRYMDMYANEKMRTLKPNDHVFMLMIDIDHFKEINDSLGHLAGDDVLKTMGWILSTSVGKKKNIIASRYGGDEFLVFGYGYTRDEVADLCSEIHTMVRVENIHDSSIQVSVSIGSVDGLRSDFKTIQEMMVSSDRDMYRAKSNK